ncbi:MAG: flagellar assembly peptidoglycan hydrolase FlgJ [Candidimonas sp.]|nr:MAG: flagellar assembly peptidoglycan hydrolase FlgJ [Candidimonas sp.]
MTLFTPQPGTGASPAFVFDQSALAALKRNVQSATTVKAKSQADQAVASQFEALFLQMILKSAHADPLFKNSLLSSDQIRMAQGLQDEQMAFDLAKSNGGQGIGLGRELLAQMRAHDGAAPSAQDKQNARLQADSVRKPGLKSGPLLDQPFNSIDEIIDLVNGAGGVNAAARNPAAQLLQAVSGGSQAASSEAELPRAFVSALVPAARHAAAQSGVPAKLILSQAALESGWGAHEMTDAQGRPTHNLFGIKAGAGWNGRVVNAKTTEYVNGQPRQVVQPFRAYGSYAQAFADYAKLIGENPRYQSVVSAATPQQAAQQIQKAGYATDPDYASKLISIMSRITAMVQAL